jgi:hypothetical protein
MVGDVLQVLRIFGLEVLGHERIADRALLEEHLVPDASAQILSRNPGVMAVHSQLPVLVPLVSGVQRMRLVR